MRLRPASILLLSTLCCPQQPALAQQTPPKQAPDDAAFREVTLEQHTSHLQQLQALVTSCSLHPGPAACDPAQVGPDEAVLLGNERRHISYEWLRSALASVAHDRIPQGKTAKANPAELLQKASIRLAEDAGPPPSAVPSHEDVERNARVQLASVLERREFSHLKTKPGWLAAAQQAFWKWVFSRLAKLASLGSGATWLGRLLLWTAILVPCAFLLRWILLQSRQQRTDLPSRGPEDAAAPSAREWQLWLAEAESFAQQQRWREAVHHVYWAAISRMEARGLWRADRARTPREYLRLLPAGNPLLPDLRVLTGAFERIWYGHRSAREPEYREACALMQRLAPK